MDAKTKPATNPWERPIKMVQLNPGSSIYTATQGGTDKFIASKGYDFEQDAERGVAVTDIKGNTYCIPWDAILCVTPYTAAELAEKAPKPSMIATKPPVTPGDVAAYAAQTPVVVDRNGQPVIDPGKKPWEKK